MKKALVFAAILMLAACDDAKPSRAVAGEEARELVAVTLDNRPLRLADYRGQVVVMNFWLAECGPCLAEMPEFDSFYKDYRDKGIAVLAINVGQNAETVTAVQRRLGVSFTLALDSLKITAERYGVLAIPASFIIDRKGALIERIDGPLNRALLIEKTAPLL
ncbi:thioredoxin [Alphaproteobacteria bacterium]|nr:thioredoxin [Alphaproteobacteria bacterium]